MKKQYTAPVTQTIMLSHTTVICVSGVGNTADFSEAITEETTDYALSRQQSLWDDDDDEEY